MHLGWGERLAFLRILCLRVVASDCRRLEMILIALVIFGCVEYVLARVRVSMCVESLLA